jgi:CBS domain-containing protein
VAKRLYPEGRRAALVVVPTQAKRSSSMLQEMTVAQFMTSPVITVNPTTPVGDAQRILKEKNIRRLPVLEDGRLVGIVTLGDIREARPSDATSLSIWEVNDLWSRLTVERVMTSKLIFLHPEDTVVEAATQMLRHKIGGLPVVDNHHKLVGIITESDLFRVLIGLHVDEKVEFIEIPQK